MAIKCCLGCVAPKRYPGCHDRCREYISEKNEHDRRKAIYDKERNISNAIYQNRSKKIEKALRDRESVRKVKR